MSFTRSLSQLVQKTIAITPQASSRSAPFSTANLPGAHGITYGTPIGATVLGQAGARGSKTALNAASSIGRSHSVARLSQTLNCPRRPIAAPSAHSSKSYMQNTRWVSHATGDDRHTATQSASSTDSPGQVLISKDVNMDYGIDYDINPSHSARLKTSDLALYAQQEMPQHLAKENEAAYRQGLNAADKHDPRDPSRTLDAVPLNPSPEHLGIKPLEHDQPTCIIASAQGDRPTMEDAHVWTGFALTLGEHTQHFQMAAILDGHGGPDCATFAMKNLMPTVKEHLNTFLTQALADSDAQQTDAEAKLDTAMANALTQAIVQLSHDYNSQNPAARASTGADFNNNAGSTLNLAIETDDKIYFANVGDSRACFISNTGEVRQLTEDHTLSCEQQRGQVFARGGFIQSQHGMHRINGRLAVAAALGAHWTNGAVSARPRITAYRKNDLRAGVIVQACDGLFEVASTKQLSERIHKALNEELSLTEAATDAINAAWQCGSRDNFTLMLRKID